MAINGEASSNTTMKVKIEQNDWPQWPQVFYEQPSWAPASASQQPRWAHGVQLPVCPQDFVGPSESQPLYQPATRAGTAAGASSSSRNFGFSLDLVGPSEFHPLYQPATRAGISAGASGSSRNSSFSPLAQPQQVLSNAAAPVPSADPSQDMLRTAQAQVALLKNDLSQVQTLSDSRERLLGEMIGLLTQGGLLPPAIQPGSGGPEGARSPEAKVAQLNKTIESLQQNLRRAKAETSALRGQHSQEMKALPRLRNEVTRLEEQIKKMNQDFCGFVSLTDGFAVPWQPFMHRLYTYEPIQLPKMTEDFTRNVWSFGENWLAGSSDCIIERMVDLLGYRGEARRLIVALYGIAGSGEVGFGFYFHIMALLFEGLTASDRALIVPARDAAYALASSCMRKPPHNVSAVTAWLPILQLEAMVKNMFPNLDMFDRPVDRPASLQVREGSDKRHSRQILSLWDAMQVGTLHEYCETNGLVAKNCDGNYNHGILPQANGHFILVDFYKQRIWAVDKALCRVYPADLVVEIKSPKMNQNTISFKLKDRAQRRSWEEQIDKVVGDGLATVASTQGDASYEDIEVDQDDYHGDGFGDGFEEN